MSQEQIFEKAKELGDLISHSELKQRADEANRALSADATAIDLINHYNDVRQEKLAEFENKQPTAEEAKAINEVLQEEFNKMAENPVIREYIEANQAFEQTLNQMDQIIKNAISGGSGCSGSCSSCGGCH
ncbi:MAG: YlbF family regulator [Clostridia bacterium]|nr:YlbF family regulator [Clostridia bacterium]